MNDYILKQITENEQLIYILIVDDSELNRRILKNILSSDYSILEAENGEAALESLRLHKNKVLAIILDLQMPIMDGYEFLERFSEVDDYANIPVIVATASDDKENEKRALLYGAWDYLTKPFDAEILLFRLKNAIAMSQLSAFQQLKYLSEYDNLTGIYNKQMFFEVTDHIVDNTNLQLVVICFDIECFHLINNFYGEHRGNELLKYIGSLLKKFCSNMPISTYGRIEANTFAVCIPIIEEDSIKHFIEYMNNEVKKYPIDFEISLVYGSYMVKRPYIKAEAMFDKANLAAKQIKGDYRSKYLLYTEDLSDKIIKEQEITTQMQGALENEDFILYLQPKYSLTRRTLYGAEALVRWLHPIKGIIPPNDFIPVFEKNGFIVKLDYYVWDMACRLIKQWIDRGLDPHPISVNVSRVNLFNPDIINVFCNLTEHYGIPKSMLKLEITESAYIENSFIIHNVVSELRSKGFIIMMDDFGSGYSSLNMLKDIEVDVLKIDMKFLLSTSNSNKKRSMDIITSVVQMAKKLSLPTIAEGVETNEQVDFLTEVGCDYAQGYFFSKPIPVSEYEKLL